MDRHLIRVFLLSTLGSDHGVKAHGDGWLLTIALIEGSGVVSAGTPGFPDPYVVFMCNGKRKTSSVKYHTSEPKWNGKCCFYITSLFHPTS
jgi:Ca2+-dependent lipid-binding protein